MLQFPLLGNLGISSPSQDTLKLGRESHDFQSLRTDMEAVKRRLQGLTGLTGLDGSAARRRAFPAELRDNISHWAQNMIYSD